MIANTDEQKGNVLATFFSGVVTKAEENIPHIHVPEIYETSNEEIYSKKMRSKTCLIIWIQ